MNWQHFVDLLRWEMGSGAVGSSLTRLIVAAILGGLIGLEREFKHRAAGLRTNMFICFGAAMFTLLSQRLAGVPSDSARIAAQIIPGIGFIGAGSILHTRGLTTGLTTAATLFVVAALLTACSSPIMTQTNSFVAAVEADTISSQRWHVTSLVKAPHPRGVAVSSSLDVYFTEEHAAGVKVLKPTGNVQDLGGDLKLPWGVAAYKSRVYVADSGNNRVLKLPSGSNTQNELPLSGLNHPHGVSVDSAGAVYVADWGNNRVLKLPPH